LTHIFKAQEFKNLLAIVGLANTRQDYRVRSLTSFASARRSVMINSETELWTKESLPFMVLSGVSDHVGSKLCLRALVLRTSGASFRKYSSGDRKSMPVLRQKCQSKIRKVLHSPCSVANKIRLWQVNLVRHPSSIFPKLQSVASGSCHSCTS
jgi:hypothetical protein